MKYLRYTLVSEGNSDVILIPIIDWLLKQHLTVYSFAGQHVAKKSGPLSDSICDALMRYPCDLLLIHRDSDRSLPTERYEEINVAVSIIGKRRGLAITIPTHICVIPVRMTEACFLFDESAIRSASGNPAGTAILNLPKKNRIEELANPKEELNGLLELAAPRKPRFSLSRMKIRLPDFIEDFSPLRGLSAFDALEQDIIRIVKDKQW